MKYVNNPDRIIANVTPIVLVNELLNIKCVCIFNTVNKIIGNNINIIKPEYKKNLIRFLSCN